MIPANALFETEVRESFQRQNLMRTLGASLRAVAPGAVEILLPWGDHLAQQSGVLHAGAIASVADSACGYAALTLMPAGSDVVSVEFKLNLTAPARGELFITRAHVVHAGRTIFTTSADIFAADGGSEKLVATMLGTMMRR